MIDDFLFTYAGLRQVVDKYLVQDRSTGKVIMKLHSIMYMSDCLQLLLQNILKRIDWTMFRTVLQCNLKTQNQHSYANHGRCYEPRFANLQVAFLLTLMTPSIASSATDMANWSLCCTKSGNWYQRRSNPWHQQQNQRRRSFAYRCCTISQKV
jgi:hypothetical protein